MTLHFLHVMEGSYGKGCLPQNASSSLRKNNANSLFVKLLQHLTTSFCMAGFTTDGEFNSLRTNGKNRPVSVIEIIKDAKKKAKSITVNTITKFFTVDANGI